jgi:hypothetical protein
MAWKKAPTEAKATKANNYAPRLPAGVTTDAIVVRVMANGVDRSGDPRYRVVFASTELQHDHAEGMTTVSGGWLDNMIACACPGEDFDDENEDLVRMILLGRTFNISTRANGEYVNIYVNGPAIGAEDSFVRDARNRMQDAILTAAQLAREEIAAQIRQGVSAVPPRADYPFHMLQSINIHVPPTEYAPWPGVPSAEEVPDDDIPF